MRLRCIETLKPTYEIPQKGKSTASKGSGAERWDASRGPGPDVRWALLVVLAVGLSAILVRGIRSGELSYNGQDEAQHGASGIFYASFLSDLPLRHPVEYAYHYYAQYPALSGVIHWPPLFYTFEGLIFLLLGPSVAAARFAILLFALVALFCWVNLMRVLENDRAEIASAILFVLPALLLFEKSVMLEIPALAVCLASTYFWVQFLQEGKTRDLYLSVFVGSLALLTKQTAVYLPLFWLLSLTSLGRWSLVSRRRFLWSSAILIGVAGPYYALVYEVHWRSIAMDLFEKTSPGIGSPRLFYLRALPSQLGWPLLGLSLLGLATCPWWAKRRANPILMGCWILAVYIVFTAIGHKEARYAIDWLPPFVYFAVGPLTFAWRRLWVRAASLTLLAVLITTFTINAWSYQRPYISGYEAAARRVLQLNSGGVVLFDGPDSSNFIFFMRALDPQRRFIVLDKALWVTRIKISGGALELAQSPQDIRNIIAKDGVQYIVVSDGVPLDFRDQQILRQVLKTPQFRLLATFRIASNLPTWQASSLQLYENTEACPPSDPYLRIRMLTLSHDIVVPFRDYEFVQQESWKNCPRSIRPGD